MSGFFYNLGRQLGRGVVPAARKSKWIWDGLTGSEEESLRAERAMGASLAAQLRTATEAPGDPETSRLVNDLCQRLESRVRGARRGFHCDVIRSDFPNAMALPGGYLFFSQSLIDLCERNPDELAFVIGHEMAHVIRGHAWDRMIGQTALRAASAAASRAGALGGWLRQTGVQLLQSAYGRDGELEADELGLRLAAAGAFNPAGAITLLRRVERLQSVTNSLGHYFASHPPASDRIAALELLGRKLSGSGNRPNVAVSRPE
jgi:beta-barrel assembly-enhancing protease